MNKSVQTAVALIEDSLMGYFSPLTLRIMFHSLREAGYGASNRAVKAVKAAAERNCGLAKWRAYDKAIAKQKRLLRTYLAKEIAP
jgi:hypothetical protein